MAVPHELPAGMHHPLYVPTETYERIATVLPFHPLDFSLAYHDALSQGTIWETLEAERSLLSGEVAAEFRAGDAPTEKSGHMGEVFSLLFKVGVFEIIQGVRESAGVDLPVRQDLASPPPAALLHPSSMVSGMTVPYNNLPEDDPGYVAQSNLRHGIRYWADISRARVFDEPVLDLEASGDWKTSRIINAAGNSVFNAMLRAL